MFQSITDQLCRVHGGHPDGSYSQGLRDQKVASLLLWNQSGDNPGKGNWERSKSGFMVAV